jgi:phosphopantothenoylcysteine decarboxylase/phosphopantothenate--cysteine ligase
LAAVLDFELVPFPHKLDREHISRHDSLTFPIRPVPDFVAAMASRRRPDQRVIAFAAESGTDAEILARAESKRQRKQVEAIVANPVRPGLGPESDRNELWVIRPDRPVEHLGPAPKTELARPLLKSLFG